MKELTRAYYRNAAPSAGGAKWPPSDVELVAQLRSATLGQALPNKSKPFPLETAWGNLLGACWRTLEGKRLAGEADVFVTLAGAFTTDDERRAIVGKIVARVPFRGDLFVTERANRAGVILGIDWAVGLPGVLTSARMLLALGLSDEASDLAYEGWLAVLELALAYRGQPGAAGVAHQLERLWSHRPFARAGFPELQEWVDGHGRALVGGASVAAPPQHSGSFERLFERLAIADGQSARRKATAKPAPAAPTGETFEDWSDLND